MEYWQGSNGCQPSRWETVDRWWSIVRAALWRTTCVLCKAAGQPQRDLCFACQQDLIANRCACAICAQPLTAASASAVCGTCLQSRPKFDASFIPYRYAYPLDRLIQRLKYHGDLSVGRVMGELFVEQLRTARRQTLPQLILPVPLGPKRYRERGFNQAIELARTISALTALAVRTDVLERARETQEQARLARKERRRNVRGAFRVLRPPECRHVALLDDVVTTGSTVNEIAKLLRRAGVQRIEVWAVARAAR